MVLIALSYLVWQIDQIIRPPQITIFSPAADITISTNILAVSGQTESEVRIKINNEDVVLDKNNNFNQTLNLQPGLNVITIEGKKKYSRTQIIKRRVILE